MATLLSSGDHVFDLDGEVWKGGDELGKEVDEALGSGPLGGRGIVIGNGGAQEVMEALQVIGIDCLPEAFLRLNISFFTHGPLDASRVRTAG